MVLPPGLTEPQQAALVSLLERARQHQRAQLDEAIERALEHVPRLLRGTLRKLLLP